MFKVLILAALMVMSPLASQRHSGEAFAEAAIRSDVAALIATLKMPETFAVMVEEGKAYGASIEDQMFPGQGGERWSSRVASIYDSETLQKHFELAFAEALGADSVTISAAAAFFGSDTGQEILQMEIAGRRALLDEAVEEAARVEAERMQSERDPRMGLIRDLVEANDLIEMNVAGALSANLAFMEGMGSVGAPGSAMDEEQMMGDVWSQEESVRDDTGKWLFPYLALAYQPLSDAELEAYLAFSQSDTGNKVNGALFYAFDQVFRRVSFDLGRAAALELQGNDI